MKDRTLIGKERARSLGASSTRSIRRILLPVIVLFVVHGCVKDPDCDTCPCPSCPRIDQLVPAVGNYGDTVLLIGDNFSATAADDHIWFNGTEVTTIYSAAKETLMVSVPNGATSGGVSIKVQDYLASDLIPGYSAPYFELASFSQVVAGTPNEPGTADGLPGIGKITGLNSIAIGNTGILYFSDAQNGTQGPVRRILGGAISTIPCSFNVAPTISIMPGLSADFIYFSALVLPYYQVSQFVFLGGGCGTQPWYTTSIPQGCSYSGALAARSGLTQSVSYIRSWLDIPQQQQRFELFDARTSNVVDSIAGWSIGINQVQLATANDMEIGPLNETYVTITDPNGTFSRGRLYKCTTTGVDTIYQHTENADRTMEGVAVDPLNGDVYFASDNRIYRLVATGSAEVFAGAASAGYAAGDGTLLNARFNGIKDIDIHEDYMYVADSGNHVIRKFKIRN